MVGQIGLKDNPILMVTSGATMTLQSGHTTHRLIFIMGNRSARIYKQFIIKCLIFISFVLYAKSLDSYILTYSPLQQYCHSSINYCDC
jgi:hypothetical protein